MNILSKSDLEQLIELRNENKNLDYKKSINWISSVNDIKLGLIKDVIAMSNTRDGGRIVFGIKDENFEFEGMKKEDYESFDQTDVNNFLHKYSEPAISCNVYKRMVEKKYVVVIDVPEFNEMLTICKKDAHSSENNKKEILRKGDIYIRTDKGTSEKVASVQEMRELVGRSLLKKGDELLHDIELLIKGRPREKETTRGVDNYKAELNDAKLYLKKVLGENLVKYGYWEVVASPNFYKKKRIPSQAEVSSLIDQAEVNLRGWNFPQTDKHGNAANFFEGRQSHTIWERHIEGYRVYESGLVVFRKIISEDIEGLKNEENTVMYFVNLIHFVTEITLFLKRLYEKIALDDEIVIGIKIKGTDNRKLISHDFRVHLNDYISKVDNINVNEKIKAIELKSDYKEISRKMVKKIFILFNWDYADDKMIDDWQSKLIERKF